MRIAALAAAVPAGTDCATGDAAGEARRARILASTGIRRRRLSGCDGPTALDLARAAAGPALRTAGWEAGSIDAAVFVTQTPDRLLPGNACHLHASLGLDARCLAFDVNLGCTGFVHGLLLADALLAAGRAHRVLLATADTISRVADPDDPACNAIFGDAGAVALIDGDGPRPLAVECGTDGRGVASLAAGGPIDARPVLRMDGLEVAGFALLRVPPMIERLLAAAGEGGAAAIDSFLLHQANRFLLEKIARRVRIPAERMPLSLDEFGNTSGASVPLTMAVRLAGRLGSGPMRLLLAGFGVGFSWAGMVIETDRVRVAPLVEIDAGVIA